jgi:chromosome partitioning protein
MRIIALMNQKGGVGKTTTTVNLGAALGEAGKRVLLIDLDPQSHLSINYGIEPQEETTSLYDVLIEDRSILEAIHQADDNIALIPSSIDLAAAEIELVSVLGREQLLKKRIESADLDFDYVLLDCPPSLGLLTLNALSVANEVIIPMQPHFLALQGVGKLLETVHLVSRRMNPGLKVAGIVLTMFDAQTKLSTEVVNDLNSFIESAKGKPLPWASARIFRSKIRRNIKLAESPSFGKTIIKYDPTSNGAIDYRNLAKEILSMEGTAVAPGTAAQLAAQGEAALAAGSPPAPVTPPSAQPPTPSPKAAIDVAPPQPESAVGEGRGEGRPTQPAPAAQPASLAPIVTPQPIVAPPKPKPKPTPKAAVLVTPEEAARLKATQIAAPATEESKQSA